MNSFLKFLWFLMTGRSRLETHDEKRLREQGKRGPPVRGIASLFILFCAVAIIVKLVLQAYAGKSFDLSIPGLVAGYTYLWVAAIVVFAIAILRKLFLWRYGESTQYGEFKPGGGCGVIVLCIAGLVGLLTWYVRHSYERSLEQLSSAPLPQTGSASPATNAAGYPRDGTTAVGTPKARPAAGSDPFEFVRRLAKTAYDGDGRAQYLISRELDRCEMTLSLVRNQAGDPETIIWSLPETGWTQPMKEGAIAELRRCIRLLKEDPFAELPARTDGYSYRYWMDRAVESGYPQAVVEKSLSDWSRMTEGGTHALSANSRSLNKLVTAAALGDPEIALTIGFRQSLYESPPRKTSASAWMLAACRLGADCSATSQAVPFWMCYDPNYPNCSADGNVELMVSNSLSPRDYGDAYAQSQLIEDALRSRDADAIRKLLEKLL